MNETKNERLYPLGYLLKILKISYTELANVIYVERTIVNKWALGQRTFNDTSPHYQNVIEYLLKINEQEENILGSFFESLNPEVKSESIDIRLAVQEFLNQSKHWQKQLRTFKTLLSQKNNYDIYVNNDTNDHFLLIGEMLDEVLKCKKKQNLIFYDNEHFKWLCDEKGYLQTFIEKVKMILEKGHHITIMFDINYLKYNFMLGDVMQQLYCYSNYRELFYHGDTPELITSYYIMGSLGVIVARRIEKAKFYSVIFHDTHSIQAYMKQFYFQEKLCTEHKAINNEDDYEWLFKHICNVVKSDEIVYMYSKGLSFLTMSIDLLEDVLKTNGVFGKKFEWIILVKKTFDKYNLIRASKVSRVRQLCSYYDIQQMVKASDWECFGLSSLLNKKITITAKQVKQHVNDTVELMNKHSNYELGFVRVTDNEPLKTAKFLCRKNQYVISINGNPRITHEVDIVNTIFAALLENGNVEYLKIIERKKK